MENLRALTSIRGLDVAREAYARLQESSNAAHLMAKELKVTEHEASQWIVLGKSWFGPLHRPHTSESTKRQEALTLAATFSLSQITIITSAVNMVRTGASMSREDVRLELCHRAPALSCDSLKQEARDLVRQINPPATKAGRFCAISKDPDAAGYKHLLLRAEEHIINNISDVILKKARLAQKTNPTVHLHQAMADSAIAALLNQQSTKQSPAPHQPALIAVLDKFEYAEGGTLVDTFGNTFTLHEAAQLLLADTGWLAIADKNADLIATFNIKNRFATPNQRMAAIIETVTCAMPGCRRLVKDGEIHHIDAYQHGGPTRQDNLIGLCRVHNGRNDDNPDRPPRNGRIVRDPTTKRAGFKPPGSADIYFSDGPIAAHDGRSLINRALVHAAQMDGVNPEDTYA